MTARDRSRNSADVPKENGDASVVLALGGRVTLAVTVLLSLGLAIAPPAAANDFLAQFTQCDRPDGSSCLNASGGVVPPFPVGTQFALEIIPGAFGGCDGNGNTASTVDWGDGTPATTGTGNVEHFHTYQTSGTFIITMSCGGYVHAFDQPPLTIGGGFGGFSAVVSAIAALTGAAGVGLSFGPRTPSPAPMPSGVTQALGSTPMPGTGPPYLGQPGGSPIPPTFEPPPPPPESADIGGSPITGEGEQPITGAGASYGPPPLAPPPTPPSGPDAKTQSGDDYLDNNPGCPDNPGRRTRARIEPKSQQWRWWCPDHGWHWG